MYDLVHRYLKRLDAELFKFKIELEADNSGITEVLEKRELRSNDVTQLSHFQSCIFYLMSALLHPISTFYCLKLAVWQQCSDVCL